MWLQHVLFLSDRAGPGHGQKHYEEIQKKYEELIRSYEGRSLEGNWNTYDDIIIKIKKINNAVKPCPQRYVNVYFTCVPEYEVIVTYEGKKYKLKYDQKRDIQTVWEQEFNERNFWINFSIKAYSDGVKTIDLGLTDVDEVITKRILCAAVGYQKETLYCRGQFSNETTKSTANNYSKIKISTTSTQKQ